jgi:hypothetical protein
VPNSKWKLVAFTIERRFRAAFYESRFPAGWESEFQIAIPLWRYLACGASSGTILLTRKSENWQNLCYDKINEISDLAFWKYIGECAQWKDLEDFLISEFESSGEVHEKTHVFSIIDMRNVIYRSTTHTGAKR